MQFHAMPAFGIERLGRPIVQIGLIAIQIILSSSSKLIVETVGIHLKHTPELGFK